MRSVSSDIFKNSLQGKTKKEYRQMSTMDTAKKKKEEEEKAENNQIQKAKTTIFYHRNVNKCQDKIRSF